MAKRNKPVDVFKHIDMKNGDVQQCWPWKKSVSGGKGRPYFDVNGVKYLAYRLTYEMYHGPIPDKQVVRHKCDNPNCCNPHHLELGSHQENMDDMVERERHGLPHHTVKSIKRLIEKGVSDAEIAERFGQTPENIAKIRQGVSYKHITTEEYPKDE